MENNEPDQTPESTSDQEFGSSSDADAIDRLSLLPDSLLHHILSLLPTLTVVRSSAVSSHFRRLSLSHLRLASSLDFGAAFSRRLPRRSSFSAAVSSLLRLHSAPRLFRFTLTFNPGASLLHRSSAASWLSFAAARSVEHLLLDFCRPIRHHFLSSGVHVINRSSAFDLPSASLPQTLTLLSLSRCILSTPPALPRLKSLSLRDVHVTNSVLNSILATSPDLSELSLRECGSLTRIRLGSDSTPSLESLTVYECPNASSIEVSGRRIRSVLLSAGHLDSCVFHDVEMLDEAFVGTRGDEFGGVLYIFMEVLASLSHVTRLALYLGHHVPSLVKDFRVSFGNLKALELVNSPLFGLLSTDVFCFFNHCDCPVLENVTVELSVISNDDDSVLEFRTPKVKPPTRVFDCLKSVKLINFRNNRTDLNLAAYFLEKTPVLDVMVLVDSRRLHREKSVKNRPLPSPVQETILGLPRSSPSAKIVFREHDEHDGLLHFLRKHHVADVYYR